MQSILDAQFAEALAHGDFCPDPAATPGATEAQFAGPAQLQGVRLEGARKQLARRIVNLAVATQVAGIMKGDLLLDTLREGELSLLLELAQQRGVVNHFPLPSQFRVFVLEGPQAMGGGGDDLLDALAVEELDVGLGQFQEEFLVSQSCACFRRSSFLPLR